MQTNGCDFTERAPYQYFLTIVHSSEWITLFFKNQKVGSFVNIRMYNQFLSLMKDVLAWIRGKKNPCTLSNPVLHCEEMFIKNTS